MLKIESQKGENMLELQNICFCVDGKKILDDINLKFDYGKIYAITGHNGSGAYRGHGCGEIRRAAQAGLFESADRQQRPDDQEERNEDHKTHVGADCYLLPYNCPAGG